MSYRGGGRGGGRGEYYKNKYGGGRGRGRGRGAGRSSGGGRSSPTGGGSYSDLKRLLQQIDSKQYPAYHDLETPLSKGWMNERAGFSLFVGRAQADPFAPPTRCRVVVSAATAQFPPGLYCNKIRSIALSDYLQRALYANCQAMGADSSLGGNNKSWSGPKGGDVQISEPSQHVLEQSAVTIDLQTGDIYAQVSISLPARGRTILGRAAEEIFDGVLETLVTKSLRYGALDATRLQKHVDSVEDQAWLQDQLDSQNLVAFVRNGAILPRASGVDDRPMAHSAIPFQSPSSLEKSFALPNAKTLITGMGIPRGVTLICGGGFHGKSTLLAALQVGIYPKIPGDGREYCVTNDKAVKIRSEDGRCVTAVDISPFISNLPFGKDTTCFSTPDASGSTSQASNIVEAVEMGANALLVDEDTCATNFMIRDDKMMQLVAADKEPITPFVRKVRSLYEDHQISSILVIGGSGDFFDVADVVVMMDCYECFDVTERAKKIVDISGKAGIQHDAASSAPFGVVNARYLNCRVFGADGKVSVRSKSVVAYGEVELDLSGLEQIVCKAQANSISLSLQKLATMNPQSDATLPATLSLIYDLIDQEGLETLAPGQFNGSLVRPRLLEIAGAVNRLRKQGTIRQKA